MPIPPFFSRANVRPWLVALVLVLASVFPVSLFFKEGLQYSVGADGQVSGKQGEVLLVTIPIRDRPDRVEGQFLKRRLTFFPVTEQAYAGLLGLDMQDRPGRYELTIEIVYPQRTERRSLSVLVMKEEYPEQRLTLPSKMVDSIRKPWRGSRPNPRPCTRRLPVSCLIPCGKAGLWSRSRGKSPADSAVAGSSTGNPETPIAVKTSRRPKVRPCCP